MGASYTNVQVHLAGRPADEVRSQVVDALRRWVLAGPFVESEPGDPDADRTIVVAPAGPEPWITIYDDFLNWDEVESLSGLARMLSADVGGFVIGIVLDDSSALELHLFRDGAPVDVFSNLPGHFRDVSPRARRAFTGRPELWQDLLVAGKSPADLRAGWDEDFIFVEETLRGVATLLDMNPQRCLANFTALEEKPEPGTIWLSFRRTTSVPEPTRAEGPPVFEPPYGGPPERDLIAGDQIRRPLLSLFVKNVGGPARGMAVVVAGPALDQGLVRIDEVVVVDRGYLTTQAVLERKEAGGERAYVARLPDWELPAGIIRPEGPPVQVGWRKQWQKYRQEAQNLPIIGVHVQGQALVAGTGELFIGAAPLANIEGGVAQRLVLRVAEPTRWQPLRAYPKQGSKLLETPLTLLALIVLGADRPACAVAVGEAIERWNRAITPGGSQWYHVELGMRPDRQGETFKLRSTTMPHGRRWRELRRALAICEYLDGWIGLRPTAPNMPWPRHEAGFVYDAHSPLPLVHYDPVLQLGLWADLEWIGETGLEEARAELTAIVDELMTQAAGLQAFESCWDWHPRLLYTAATPYEGASDVGGSPMGRDWCSRFLRGVSDTVWLGPELLDRLGNRDALAAVADLTPIGNALQVTLKETTDLTALERALAPLLPSHEDWREEMDRLSSRHMAEEKRLGGMRDVSSCQSGGQRSRNAPPDAHRTVEGSRSEVGTAGEEDQRTHARGVSRKDLK